MMTERDRNAHGTSSKLWTWALVLTLGAWVPAIGGERGCPDPGRPPVLQRLRPAGGWHPDGGGLLHWWEPHCFPRCGGPDDYCRKPPPDVCWPPYPPYYIWGPPAVDHP
jgi:hypothetical protein